MNQSKGLKGVHGRIHLSQLESEPGGKIARISAKRRGAVRKVDKALRVHSCFPLPMGMEREDRCE